MAVIRRMVSMKPEDCLYIDDNAICLSKFVRNSIKKLKENSQTVQVKPFSESEDSI